MKKQRDSLKSQEQSTPLARKKSSHSETSIYEKPEYHVKGVKQLYREFFDLRTHLLQWHLLNAETKEKIKLQTKKQENEFFNRFIQIINLQNNELEMRLQNDYKIAIKHLEDILGIEFPTIKEIYPKIDHFITFAGNLGDYLSSSLKKTFLGEGVSVDVGVLNDLLKKTEKLFDEIFAKHASFFQKYEEIRKLLSENVRDLKEQVYEIKIFIQELKENEEKINHRVYQQLVATQEENLKTLEKDFLD